MSSGARTSEGATEALPGPDGQLQSESAGLTPELRDRLLYYAWRAPSPHNAQGWRIEVDGLRFRVSRDPARQVLGEFDPGSREGDLACGAVVTNLCVGARAFGFDAEVRWRPADGVAADVTLLAAPAPPDEAAAGRLRALRRRAVNRSPYRAEAVAGSVIDELQATAGRLGFTLLGAYRSGRDRPGGRDRRPRCGDEANARAHPGRTVLADALHRPGRRTASRWPRPGAVLHACGGGADRRRRHASARARRASAVGHGPERGGDGRPGRRPGTAAQRARPVPAARQLAGG